MDFLAPLITFANQWINNYTLTIVIFVVAFFGLTIPFRIFNIKNQRAKNACIPEVQRIRKKYNATALGPSMTDDAHLTPEIRAMSINERDEAMANEIAAVYKQNGYHAFIAFLPSIALLMMIILLYSGLTSAIPNDYYATTWSSAGGMSQYFQIPGTIIAFACLIGSSLLSPLESLITGFIEKKSVKSILLTALIQIVFSAGITFWFATRMTLTISIALTTLSVMSFILSLVEKHITQRHKEANNN